MAILNAVKREIVAKIVYYGPGLSGKTLNIQKIHEQMDPANVGEMTSLATESDRTLFFDFVPIQLGSIAGLNTRFQLFTVPGQVFYNQTRRTVLENTDGVVFVADSQPEQLENNLESLANLEENLAFYGKKLADTPFVLQFNKQDIPGCMTEEELNKVLNKFNVPSLKASCFEGYGVMETLAKISTMVLSNLREQMTKRTPGAANTLKRTYSKEGVSDEQVVSNLLSDIAAAGGVAEARAAGDVPPAPAPAAAPPVRPAAPPVNTPSGGRPAVRPAAIVPGGAAAKPAAPAAAAPAAAPKIAPRPTVPAAAPMKSTSISPEDLLNDLDAGSPPKKAPAFTPTPAPPRTPAPQTGRFQSPPPAAAAPAPAARPPLPSGPPPPPPSARVAVPAPIPGPPSQSGTAAGLRSSARPVPTPGLVAKTAEELLENMEQEERSGTGAAAGLVQESRGSFGSNLWGDDDEGASAGTGKMPAPPAPKNPAMQPRPLPAPAANLGAGLFDLDGDEAEDPSNRTSVVNGGSLKPNDVENTPASAALMDAAAGGPLRVQSVGQAVTAGGVATFSVMLTDGGRQVPVQLSVGLGDLSKAKKGGSGIAIAALLIGLLNLLAVLGLAGLVLSQAQ